MLPIPKCYSENLKYFISILLRKDPSMRPSIRDILSSDSVVEKMRKLKFNVSPQEKNKSPNQYVMNSPMNLNQKSPNSIYTSCSPVNENHQNFYLFNLKFDNLLKGIHDDRDSNSGSNSKSSSSLSEKEVNYGRNVCNKFKFNKFETDLNNNHPMHRKYSPSFSQVDYNMIINPVLSHSHSKSRFISTDNVFEYGDNNISRSNLNNKLKNHFSDPMLHVTGNKPYNIDSPIYTNPINRTRHGRHHSMNCDVSEQINSSNNNFSDYNYGPQIKKSFFSNINSNCVFQQEKKIVHSIISKHLNNKSETNNKIYDKRTNGNTNNNPINKNYLVNHLNSTEKSLAMADKINIKIDADKYKKYKETLNKFHNRNHSKSIELNYFSMQEAKNKEDSCNFLVQEIGPDRFGSHAALIKTDNNGSRQKNLKQSETSFYLNKLLSHFGENIVNSLINLIENSLSPIKILNGNGKEIEKIVGKDYKAAQSYLMKIFIFDDNSLKTDRVKNNL